MWLHGGMKNLLYVCTLAGFALFSTNSMAEDITHATHNHSAMMATGSAHHQPLANEPYVQESLESNKIMHRDMDIVFTGDADIDFLKAMIPHHQGAIDMARTVLKYGKDPQNKRLARAIIRAQKGEIFLMKNRLKQLEERKKGYDDITWLGDTHDAHDRFY